MTGTGQPLQVLRKRSEFLSIAKSGRKWVAPTLILQQALSETKTLRYGLTASSKIGNAVTRNRARRRLRALTQDILPSHAVAGDYVLIARATTAICDYTRLRNDLITALQKLKAWKNS